jgi:hypothetical protein
VTYHHNWLWLVGQNGFAYELFNGARTAAYLQNPPGDGLQCGVISDVLDMGGCAAYAWEPPCTPDSSSWQPQTFSSPEDDEAPWYSASHPESAEALGFWIEEWTGLDASHVSRSVQRLGRSPGGGTFGRGHATERVMKFNVLLFGLSEKSLEYLYRWLEATLIGVCGSCEQDSILIRRYCPPEELGSGATDDQLWDGVVLLREVGLVEGLTWESAPVEKAGCVMRRLSFTLAAGDPCMYANDVELTSFMFDPDACMEEDSTLFDQDFVGQYCRPSCGYFGDDCRATYTFTPDVTGAAVPVVTIRNTGEANPSSGAPRWLPKLSIRFYADPAGMGLGVRCALPLLGEVHISELPPGAVFTYDVAGRRILYDDGGTALPVSGWAFVEENAVGIPRFFALPCTEIHMVVEVDDRCYDSAADTPGPKWIKSDTFEFYPPEAEITIQMMERFGCP